MTDQSKKSHKIRIVRSLVLLIGVGLFLVIAGVSFFYIDAVGFRRVVFQPVREVY